MVNDVEKRWHDPRAFRAAAHYTVLVVVIAGAALTWYATHDRYCVAWAVATPAILFAGGVGAMIKTYHDWRAERTWPIWQGAGWFLLTLTLLSLSIPAMGLNRPA